MKDADGHWIYVRLPVSIQEELPLLKLREKPKDRPHRWPVPPKKNAVDVKPKHWYGKNKPKTGIVGAQTRLPFRHIVTDIGKTLDIFRYIRAYRLSI